jgi:ATP-dependent DNA helicase RecQ
MVYLGCHPGHMLKNMFFPGSCDNCCGGIKVEKDVASDALIMLLCIKEMEGRFGINLPIDVLRGSNVCA